MSVRLSVCSLFLPRQTSSESICSQKKIPFIIYLFHSFLSITAIFLITGKNINFFNDFVYVIPILNHFHEIDNLKYHPIFRQNEVRNSRAFRISKEEKKKKKPRCSQQSSILIIGRLSFDPFIKIVFVSISSEMKRGRQELNLAAGRD